MRGFQKLYGVIANKNSGNNPIDLIGFQETCNVLKSYDFCRVFLGTNDHRIATVSTWLTNLKCRKRKDRSSRDWWQLQHLTNELNGLMIW